MTDERDTLDAQSYHLLRIADIVGSLGGYVSASRPLPSGEQFSGTTLFDFSKGSKRKIIRDLASISEKIQKDFKHIFELRQQFWHPDAYARTAEESQQAWQHLAASIPDDKLVAIRETLRTSIDSLKGMRYGAHEFSARQQAALTEMGLYRSIEAIELLDTEISKVQAVRAQTPSTVSVRESAMLYRRATNLVGSNSAERNNLAHQFYDNGNRRPEPFLTSNIRARFGNASASQEQTEALLWVEFEEQLKSGMLMEGNLPDGVSELLRLVDHDTDEGRKFQTYMEDLTHKMLPGWDFKKHPIRFFVSDSDEVNASVLKTEYKPAFMFFNKGLLKLVGKNENMLLHVHGHELGHGLFQDALGDLKISKVEEALVNLPNIQWMYENGIDPRGALQFAKKVKGLHEAEKKKFHDERRPTDPNLESKESSFYDTLEILINAKDEHPNPAINIDLVNTALTGYRNKVSGSFDDCKQLGIPSEMQRLFSKVVHESVVQRRAREYKFEEMSWEKQLEFIRDELRRSDEGHVLSRARTLLPLLQMVENDVNEHSRALGNEIIAALRHKPEALGEFYPTIAGNLFNVRADVLLPPISDIVSPLKAIEQAKSPADFAAAVEKYTKVRQALEGYPLVLFRLPEFFRVENPIGNPNQPANMLAPWNKQVKWAIEDLKKGDTASARILLSMGVEDPRLYMAFERVEPSLDRIANYWEGSRLDAEQAFEWTGEKVAKRQLEERLKAFEYVVQGDNLFLAYPPRQDQNWDKFKAIEAAVQSGGHISYVQPQNHASNTKTTVPQAAFEDPLAFKRWLQTDMVSLRAPESLTDTNDHLSALHNKLHAWYIEDADFRARALADPKSNAKYTKDFYAWFQSEIAPFHRQTQSLTELFDAQLKQNPEAARTIIRDFYLNPSDQPGLKQMLNSGKVEAQLSAHSPLFEFVANHAELFSAKEKAAIFGVHFNPPSTSSWWEKVLGTGVADNPKKLATLVERISQYRAEANSIQSNYIDGLRAKYPEKWAILYDNRLRDEDVAHALATRLSVIIGTKEPGDINLNELLSRPAHEFMQEVFDLPFERDAFSKDEDGKNGVHKSYNELSPDAKLATIMREHLASYKHWPADPIQYAKIYKNIDGYDLFPSHEHQKQFSETMLAKIKAMPEGATRIEAIQTLLAGKPVSDASLRTALTGLWTEAVRHSAQHGVQHGLDNGSPAYLKEIMPHIEWAEANMAAAERYRLFTQLATELESQRELSYRLRDSFKLTKEGILGTDAGFRVGEAVFMLSTHDAKNRQALLDYLVRSPTEESHRRFAKHLKQLTLEAEQQTWSIFDENSEAAQRLTNVVKADELAGYYERITRNLHENFQHASLPARIALLDQLLIAHDEKDYSTRRTKNTSEAAKTERAFKSAFTYVADMLLPEGMQYSAEARKSLDAYSKTLPPNERGLFLSAMLAANDATKAQGSSIGVGDRLAIMLEIMGPAETKFGQALSNYPDAPMDIRQPMVRLTKQASPSPRWDLWQRFDDIVPDAVKTMVKRMGPVRGNGSYQEGVRLEKTDGDHSIMKLQRPSVERRAAAGFNQLRLFIEEIRQNASMDTSVTDATDRIVKQAQEMASRETNVEYRLAQVKQAQQYYNPVSITVDGHTFKFRTADWLAYGVDRAEVTHRIDRHEWCEEREMPGVHFDELPMETKAQKDYVKAVAKATIAAEMYVLLSGRPIDNDRHPAQMRVNSATDTIGLFDHGAMDLTPPTHAEKQLLAKIFVSATQAYKEGTSLPHLFYQQLKETKETLGHVPDYLVKVERGVLAMSRFFEHLDATDMKDVLAAVHSTGAIDQAILDTKIKVKLPVIGETEIKLSTALDRTLPKSSAIKFTLAPESVVAEPVRYDFVATKPLQHPKFPGVAASPSAGTGANGNGTGHTSMLGQHGPPLNSIIPSNPSPLTTAMAAHTPQSHALIGSVAGNDSTPILHTMGGESFPALMPVAASLQQIDTQQGIVADPARLAANEPLTAKPANLPSGETSAVRPSNQVAANKPEHTAPSGHAAAASHVLAAQRHAIQSGANNGIGVAMGAYGLWSKFNDKDGTFHEDMKSGDKVRQAAAVTGVVMDVANIGAGAVSTAADAKTFQQAKVKGPTSGAPVNAAPASAAATPTAATTSAPAQASTPSATAPKATAPTAPTTAPTSAGTPTANAVSAPQAPSTPTAQAQGGANAGSTAQQAEKVAAEALKDGAKAALQASKTGETLLKAGKFAGKAAIPLAIATGAVDASAGARAGDRERVAGAVGSTGGGILGGMALGMAAGAATGAIWGSAVPGVGTIVVGVAAGLVGGIAGAVAGEEASKHYLSGVMGKLTGADDKFLEAMKQLDPATQKQFAKAGAKLTLDGVHEILKGGKMDSVAHVDTSKDGKISGVELKAALEKARAVFIDNQLTEQLSALEAKGWGKILGDKDGKLTLDELKTSLKDKGIDLANLIRDEKITGKAITDAIAAIQAAAPATAVAAVTPPRTPAAPVASQARH